MQEKKIEIIKMSQFYCFTQGTKNLRTGPMNIIKRNKLLNYKYVTWCYTNSYLTINNCRQDLAMEQWHTCASCFQ